MPVESNLTFNRKINIAIAILYIKNKQPKIRKLQSVEYEFLHHSIFIDFLINIKTHILHFFYFYIYSYIFIIQNFIRVYIKI